METPKNPALLRTNTKILEFASPSSSKMQRRTSSILKEYPSHLAKSSEVLKEDPKDPSPEDANSWMYHYLPKDIIFFIFKMLSRNDLATASIVCKYWRKISKDPYFGWTTLDVVNFRQEYIYTGEGDGGDAVDFIIEKDANYYWSTKHFLINEKKQKICEILYGYNTIDQMEKYKKLCDTQNGMYRWFFQKDKDEYEKTKTGWKFVCEISVLKYEEIIASKAKITPPWVQNQIWNTITSENLRAVSARVASDCIGSKIARRPKKTSIPQKQPRGFKEGINLFKYQLDALAWMKSVEDDLAAKISFKYTTVVPWRSARTRYLYDLDKKLVLTADKLDTSGYTFSFQPRGAVLADEMGLGKTMEMLGLILANPPSDEELEAMRKWNSRVLSDAELVFGKGKENHLDRLRYKSRATLVACPNHLAQQWQDELMKHTDPPLKVLRFTTMNELKASSYQEILDADAVIFSYQLLKNGSYNKIGTSRSHISRFERPFWVSNQLKRVLKWIKDGEPVKDPPLLEHFEWHRMVLDEAHEVITDDAAQDTFAMYPAKYYWYISGTPFPNQDCLKGLLEFFEFPKTSPHNLWTFTDILLNNLYWRSTKDSVKDEFTVPPVVEDVVLLDFSDTEKALYSDNVGKSEIQRKLCSQLLDIDHSNSLTELNKAAIALKKRNILEAEAEIENQNKEIAHLNTLAFAYVPNAIAKCKEKKKALKQDIEHHKRIIQLLEAATPFKDRLQHLESVFNPSGAQSNANNNNNNAPSESASKPSLKESKKEQPTDQMDEESPKDSEKKPEANEKTESMEVEQEEKEKKKPVFPSSDKIKKMTVPQLKKELAKHGIEPKKLKAELITQLQEYISQNSTGEDASNDNTASEEKESKKRKETEKYEMTQFEFNSIRDETEPPQKKPKSKKGQVELPKPASDTMSKYDLAKELLYLVENFGTKMGNMMFYLRRLWDKKPEARVIIFSQYNSVLHQVSEILDKGGIPSVFVTGTVISKNKALNAFKAKDSPVRVIMLSLEKAASGTNLVEASHVILVDPVAGTRKEAQAVEAQAVGRAYRQGQPSQVTMVRFLIKDTIEHRMYIKNYLEDEQQNLPQEPSAIQRVLDEANALKLTRTASCRPNMFRSSSITTLLVNSPKKSSASVVALIENVNDELPAPPATDPIEQSSNNNNDGTETQSTDNNQQQDAQ